MFNDKQQEKSKKLPLIAISATVIALALTFGYTSNAYAQIQAKITKPVLKTDYKGTDTINLDNSVNLMNGNRKISVSLRDSDLKQTLRMIADKAGLNIIFHSSVTGTITLDLVNVSLNDAFKMIMQASDLSFVIEKGTLIVMSKDASSKSDIAKQNMMTIPVKYADSSKVADFLNSNVFSTNRPGLSNNKIVVTNPVTNELVIFGTQNDYKMAQKIVSKLDVAPNIHSYRVNHTTPKEMATLICQSLFPTAQTTSGAGSSGAAEPSPSSAASLLGAPQSDTAGTGSNAKDSSPVSGNATGGASSIGDSNGSSSGSGSGSSGSGSSSKSSSSTSTDGISLGEGKIACTIKGEVSANTLKSLSGTSLSVTYFPQKGTINVIGGSDSQAEMIKNFIKTNDKKQPQAYVACQIVELSESGSKDFQNKWTLLTPFLSATFDGENGVQNFNNTPTYFTGGPYSVTTTSGTTTTTTEYTRFSDQKTVAWEINYLIKTGKGRLLANPKVMVTNGKKSLINLTSDYIKISDEEIMTSSNGSGVAGVSRTYEIGDDNGISVEMTPFISPDGYVTMNLKPNYSTIKEQVKSPSSSGGSIIAATLLQRRNLDLSNIRIKDGETLVLGGLIQEEEKKNVSKVPFLGDVPYVGSLFRSTSTTNEKNELVIMITPRIIKDTEDVASDNENL